MHSNGLMLSGALEEFSITYQLFEEIKRFESSFYRIEVQVFTNPSNQIEKHQTLDFWLMTTFMIFLKKSQFLHFSDNLEKHQLYILKLLHVLYLMRPC